MIGEKALEEKQWKYKIGAGRMPVILSLGMTVLFGSLSVWLHKTENGASFFGDILTGIMALIFVVTVYRMLFYKVLIGKDGFYYQSHIANGMYHNYAELKNAWITAGRNLSGQENKWCHFETADGKVTRFVIYDNDEKAARYLVKRVHAETAGKTQLPQQHRIDGKAAGAVGLVAAFVTVGMVCIFTFPLLQLGNIALVMGFVGLLMAAYLLVNTLFTYFCFQVKIEEDGFYYQTNPFNGRYFSYADITRCWEVERVYRYRRSANRNHYFYLYFTDRYGKTRRFLYENDIYGYEINILKEKINNRTDEC